MNYYQLTIDNGYGLTFDVFITAEKLTFLTPQIVEADGVQINFGLDILSIIS